MLIGVQDRGLHGEGIAHRRETITARIEYDTAYLSRANRHTGR